MKKSKIYTTKGDGGETSLLSGERVPKSDPRIEYYGSLDEVNSFLGLARSWIPQGLGQVDGDLEKVQRALFHLGAGGGPSPEDLSFLEGRIDFYDGALEELKNFILPGGSRANGAVHVCRAVTRRAERRCPPQARAYLNRLSDFFFVVARYILWKEGRPEQLWRGEH